MEGIFTLRQVWNDSDELAPVNASVWRQAFASRETLLYNCWNRWGLSLGVFA